MPKERVYDSAGMYDLEVGWSGLGEYVQLGLATHDGRPIVEHLRESDLPPQSGDTYADFRSLWSTLDRGQINRLIRMLRKARDESYGKDE